MLTLTKSQLAYHFDHTLLKADATPDQFEILCQEAKDNGFRMVAINSAPVSLCRSFLKDSPVHVGAAISFPLGQTVLEVKKLEIERAIAQGADEIDYVVNLTQVKTQNWGAVQEEMEQLTQLCRQHNTLIKVIFENCYLEKNEIKKLALMARDVKPDFIKTSTGFGTGGATVEDLVLMKQVVGDAVAVKAAGGIRSWAVCKEMLEAGAERIGTSSSLKILSEFEQGV